MDIMQAKQSVVAAGRRLLDEGLVARTWGNVSCRTGADTFVITPSGLGYDGMTADDVVPFCMADGTHTGARKPSSEKGVHAAMYRRFPDAGFVIHTHQTYATALGLAGFDGVSPTTEQEAALGGLALAAYGLPGTKKLVRAVAVAVRCGAHTVLMAHHGVLVAGKDADEAFARATLLEQICRAVLKGQPAETADDAESRTDLTKRARAAYGQDCWPKLGELVNLVAKAREAFPAADAAVMPAVVAASQAGRGVRAQLDDAAQMIGLWLPVVPADERAVLSALKTHDAVLVRGLGAICRADTEGDAAALCLLAEKACVAFLHAHACGKRALLSAPDVWLMRRVYLTKYSKKIEG